MKILKGCTLTTQLTLLFTLVLGQNSYEVNSKFANKNIFFMYGKDTNDSIGRVTFNNRMPSYGHAFNYSYEFQEVIHPLEIKSKKICHKLQNCYPFKKNSTGDYWTATIPGLRNIRIEEKKAERSSVNGDLQFFYASQSKFGEISVYNSRIEYIRYYEDTISDFQLQSSIVNNFIIDDSYISRLSIKDVRINEFQLYNVNLPMQIDIRNLLLNNDQEPLDLTGFRNDVQRICMLSANLNDIKKIKFNYINYSLAFSNLYLVDKNEQFMNSYMQSMFMTIIDLQKRYGFTDGEEKATKEYKEFEYTKNGSIWGHVKNEVDKRWTDYGYHKERIFWNTFILFSIFFSFNLLCYKWLSKKVYPVEEFVVNDRSTNKVTLRGMIRYASYTLFYTGYIFFGLKLDYDLLKLRNLWGAAYIVLQFVTGIICLAYLANYIISR